MASGNKHAHACAMTKWYGANFHYIIYFQSIT
ncbi:hypothetical protein [Alkalihalobacillus deserti]